ncbi:MAG: histidine kinase [Clostridia bacterium]|nr:histidine kinase [Clostridia bacterium]
MTKRIFRSIIAVVLVAFVSAVVAIPMFLYSYFENQIEAELEKRADVISAAVENYGVEYLSLVEERAQIISHDGDIIYNNNENLPEEDILKAYASADAELSDGSVVRIFGAYETVWTAMLRNVWPLLLLLIAVLVLSVFWARSLAENIVSPINSLDLEKPEIGPEYKEISTLLHRIKMQNNLINLQMNDLKLRRQEIEVITEYMEEGFIVVDKKAKILTYNKSALKLLDITGVNYGESIYSLGLEKPVEETVKNAIDGTKGSVEWRSRERVFQVFSNPVTVEDNAFGAVVLIFDVTEKAERETMRREFTSNVSHELKTPLTSIYGISEIIMNGIVKPEDVGGFAESIHTESGRLISLINDIIKISQLDENKVPLEKEPVDLMMVAKEVKTRLHHVIAKKGIVFEIKGDSVYVEGIAAILSEMVYNLCDNAIKYNKDGGLVELTVGKRDGRPFVRVRDTGIGIPASAQPRVFERFYRVDKSHSKEMGGTGLGLSIVKHGAAYHGAEINLESKLGEGTVIEIVF